VTAVLARPRADWDHAWETEARDPLTGKFLGGGSLIDGVISGPDLDVAEGGGRRAVTREDTGEQVGHVLEDGGWQHARGGAYSGPSYAGSPGQRERAAVRDLAAYHSAHVLEDASYKAAAPDAAIWLAGARDSVRKGDRAQAAQRVRRAADELHRAAEAGDVDPGHARALHEGISDLHLQAAGMELPGWVLHEPEERPPDTPGQAALRQSLESGASGSPLAPQASGAQAYTTVVPLADGSKAVRKARMDPEDADREELSARVSDVLGAGAPAVIREAPGQVAMSYVDGVPGARWMKDQGLDAEGLDAEHEAVLAGAGRTEAGLRIGALDWLTRNTDRHAYNWMVTADGTPVPIDHGNTFDGTDLADFGIPDSPFKEALRDAPERAFSDSDLSAWRAGLQDLAPEFSRLGRDEWLQEALRRLGELEADQKSKPMMTEGRKRWQL
jgi:hypothetical protein